MKKVIAFDLDGTIAHSKSQVDDQMVILLEQLLTKYIVCVISGGNFAQFENQLLSNLKLAPSKLSKLHIMPTCGTKYFAYKTDLNNWVKVYSEDIPLKDRARIKNALIKGFTDLNYVAEKSYGEVIEDRGSQITYSALGQDIVDILGKKGLNKKEAWDPDTSKKNKLRDYIQLLIPDYEVRVGGVTSIDVTKKGIDKAYGINKLINLLKISINDILFIGDRLQPGGNDYPVKELGVDSIEVSNWHETAKIIEVLNYI